METIMTLKQAKAQHKANATMNALRAGLINSLIPNKKFITGCKQNFYQLLR
jgi:DNA-binding transcriptional regulator LsrR (DeoR family)